MFLLYALLIPIILIYLSYVIYCVYYNLKYRFWRTQPVFHYYDLSYWIIPIGKIHTQIIPANNNKYYEPNKIITIPVPPDNDIDNILSKYDIVSCFNLIKEHYLNEKDIIYKPDVNDIKVYLKGHSNNSFISYFYETELLTNETYDKYGNGEKREQENKINNISSIVQRPIIKSVLIMRPLNVVLNKTYKFITNYVDFLCTGKKWRKKGITPKLINTTVYNTNKYNYENTTNINENTTNINEKIVNNYFFKNEDKKTNIVPFIVFKSYFYDVKYWKGYKYDDYRECITQEIKLSLITNDNINIFIRNFEDTIKEKFKNTFTSSLNNIIDLINEKQLFIFCMMLKDEVIDWYFFKNSHMLYKEKHIYECIGSICGEKNNKIDHLFTSKNPIKNKIINKKINNRFINGFYNCISYLKCNYNISYINIENISNNNLIINNLLQNKEYISSTTYNYYFYNYIVRPHLSNETFILC